MFKFKPGCGHTRFVKLSNIRKFYSLPKIHKPSLELRYFMRAKKPKLQYKFFYCWPFQIFLINVAQNVGIEKKCSNKFVIFFISFPDQLFILFIFTTYKGLNLRLSYLNFTPTLQAQKSDDRKLTEPIILSLHQIVKAHFAFVLHLASTSTSYQYQYQHLSI